MQKISKPFARFLSAAVGAMLVLGVLDLTLWGKENAPNITISTTPVNRDAKLGTSFGPIVKKTAPSVVNISSTTIRQRPANSRFFGLQQSPRRVENLGSGIIISPDGYILTASHVVEGAVDVEVSVAGNKKPFTAKIIGTDPPTD